MKPFIHLVGTFILLFSCSILAATINGRFNVVNSDSSSFTVLLQINTDSGVNELGGATMVFEFDTTAVSFPDNPVKEVDYLFHNFDGGNYSSATITKPMKNRIWVNIDLPYENSNNGTLIAVNPEWTDIATVHFDVVDISNTANLQWLINSPFWGIYDSDNSSLWETGEFEGFPTSVEPGAELLTNFELSQNYPNPFNPATKIQYTVPSLLPDGVSGIVPVKLKVYDILGNVVATLVDEEKAPGTYEVTFDSNSGEVRNLASGIYIYRMETIDFLETKKMVLLK